MRKHIVVFLAVCAGVIGLAACGGTTDTNTQTTAPATTPAQVNFIGQVELQNQLVQKVQARIDSSATMQGDNVVSVDCTGGVSVDNGQTETWSCHGVINTPVGPQDSYTIVTAYPTGYWISK